MKKNKGASEHGVWSTEHGAESKFKIPHSMPFALCSMPDGFSQFGGYFSLLSGIAVSFFLTRPET